MLKITNDDNQLTDKVNKILNNDTENNVKKATIAALGDDDDDFDYEEYCKSENERYNKAFKELQNRDCKIKNHEGDFSQEEYEDLGELRGTLYALLGRGDPDYEKYFAHLSKRNVKNKYTFIIEDNCGDDWVFDLINTCAEFSNLKVTYYSLSEILKMPYDVACARLGDINLSEYESDWDIRNSLHYIEKLKHIINCKFVITFNSDYVRDKLDPSVYNKERVAYIELFIPSRSEYTERLLDFKNVYMRDVLRNVLCKNNKRTIVTDEDIESFWECI